MPLSPRERLRQRPPPQRHLRPASRSNDPSGCCRTSSYVAISIVIYRDRIVIGSF